MLTILAEAGLGRSRLISETRALLPANVKWAKAARFPSPRRYWLARAIVLSLLNVKPEAAQSKLRQHCKSLNGQSEIYPFLARLLELPVDAVKEERVKFPFERSTSIGDLEALRGRPPSRP
jgi:hypothetical protein